MRAARGATLRARQQRDGRGVRHRARSIAMRAFAQCISAYASNNGRRNKQRLRFTAMRVRIVRNIVVGNGA